MLLIAAPGQGAQTPGFLSPWLELPGFAERLAAWSELAGCDLIRCGTTADADEIRDTAVAQPLLVAAAIAKDHPVPLALLHHQRIDVRPRLLVDRPGIELRARLRAEIAKRKLECFVRHVG